MFKFAKSAVVNYILVLILTLATFLRFYHFSDRFVFNQDQARDATIALYALRQHKLPFVGTPSSSGPFNFGALYYWFVILISYIFPSIKGPWFGYCLIYTSMVFVFYHIGKNIIGRKLGLLMALVTAVSPLLVSNSLDMLNTSAVFIAVSLNFLVLSKLLKKVSFKNLFWFGFTVGLANNFHFQSLGFGSILIAYLIVFYKNSTKTLVSLLSMGLGYLVSFLPNLYFDITHSYVWLNSIYSYFFQGGTDKFYYPVRWLTDIRDFWPQLWGQIITGLPSLGYIFIFIFLVTFKKILKTPLLHKFNLILLISLAIQVILMRYYKGVRSPEYLVTFYAYFVVFTGSCLYLIGRGVFQKTIIISLFFIICLYSCLLQLQKKSQAHEVFDLYSQLGPEPYRFYTSKGPSQINYPLYYLQYRNHPTSNGDFRKIATCQSSDQYQCPDNLVIASSQHYQIYDLDQVDPGLHQQYFEYTPDFIYNILYINYPNAKN